MDLKKIKLSGFKSFVDPTVITFPSSRVAVVGPNGCGKSNVIDAVRMVLGESSAKHLRGESLTDLIFNGSSQRKPVGQASVELVFDNGDGRLGGAYAQYAEIAIRREVTRDGNSSYFLNGTRCRKKDISDIFLGTGMGPRSYSIIAQGTISQVIEAKPQELRHYLEEAAGISKYKERRRETELRMEHTRDNLIRLEDIREECDKQLRHLKRQSTAAEQYQSLKADLREQHASLLALKWQGLESARAADQHALSAGETQLEELNANATRIEAAWLTWEDTQVTLQSAVDEAQTGVFNLTQTIRDHQHTISSHEQQQKNWTQELSEIERQLTQNQSQTQSQLDRITHLTDTQAALTPEHARLQEALNDAQQKLDNAREAREQWQLHWDAFTEDAARQSESIQVARTSIDHLRHTIQKQDAQAQALQARLDAVDYAAIENDVREKTSPIESLEATLQSQNETHQALTASLATAKQGLDAAVQTVADQRAELRATQGRYEALLSVQAQSVGADDKTMQTWLSTHGLAEAPRLLSEIEVHDAWRHAVECVLTSRLQSVCVTDISACLTELENEWPQGGIALCELHTTAPASKYGLTALSTQIRSDHNMGQFLNQVYMVSDLAEAKRLQPTLDASDMLVTPEGVLCGRTWLQTPQSLKTDDGVLAREQTLRDLKEHLKTLAEQLETAQTAQANAQAEVQRLEAELKTSTDDQAATQQALIQAKSALAEAKANLSQTQAMRENLTQQRQAIVSELSQLNVTLSENEAVLEETLSAQTQIDEKRSRLQADRDAHQMRYDAAFEDVNHYREETHAQRMQLEKIQTEVSTLRNSQTHLQAQYESLTARQTEISEALSQSENPLAAIKAALQEALGAQSEAEQTLSKARQAHAEHGNERSGLQSQKQNNDHALNQLRSTLEEKRLSVQTSTVQQANLVEQLDTLVSEMDCTREEVLDRTFETETVESCQAEMDKLQRKIDRLGPINLAAIDEYQQQLERKTYLDAQHQDLSESLDLLDAAIRKIDNETKQMFKETFEKVNAQFGVLFPKIFGGGKAELTLTENDWLNAGVEIMARPPGKRNSTIHLLSGGEKALTAIAFVFGIFQLNPAPFCMLDEVDAPLDDANVMRFCQIVKEMSETVKFIIVSHNKITIELAEQLIGVTMAEPGVSRLVSVDIEKALQMAEA